MPLTRELLRETAGRVEKRALSDNAYAAIGGALGGAGLGALNWLIRPKDRDQRKLREFLTSTLSGAGLGAVAGYGLNQIPGLDLGKRINYYRHPNNVKLKLQDVWSKIKAGRQPAGSQPTNTQTDAPADTQTSQQADVTPSSKPSDPTVYDKPVDNKLKPGNVPSQTGQWMSWDYARNLKDGRSQFQNKQVEETVNSWLSNPQTNPNGYKNPQIQKVRIIGDGIGEAVVQVNVPGGGTVMKKLKIEFPDQ